MHNQPIPIGKLGIKKAVCKKYIRSKDKDKVELWVMIKEFSLNIY